MKARSERASVDSARSRLAAAAILRCLPAPRARVVNINTNARITPKIYNGLLRRAVECYAAPPYAINAEASYVIFTQIRCGRASGGETATGAPQFARNGAK
ncbi:unnamed protein product, partial [Iphiclides podalirius]